MIGRCAAAASLPPVSKPRRWSLRGKDSVVSPLTLALVLCVAVAHATWNLLAKRARDTVAFTWLFATLAIGIYLPLIAVLVLFAGGAPDGHGLAWMAFSGCLQVAYFTLLTRAYRIGDLSLVYPLARGTGPAVAVAGGVLLYGERPSALALGGVALIVLGVLVMTAPGRGGLPAGAGRAIMLALATGVCIAAYTLWDKRGVQHVNPLVYNYGTIAVIALALAAPVLGNPARRKRAAGELRCNRAALLGVAVLSPLAYGLVLIALRLSPVSYVAPAREISIVLGAAFGARLLREGDAGRRLSGASAIVVGVLALALG